LALQTLLTLSPSHPFFLKHGTPPPPTGCVFTRAQTDGWKSYTYWAFFSGREPEVSLPMQLELPAPVSLSGLVLVEGRSLLPEFSFLYSISSPHSGSYFCIRLLPSFIGCDFDRTASVVFFCRISYPIVTDPMHSPSISPPCP